MVGISNGSRDGGKSVFNVEYYFRSYVNGYHEHFNKQTPSNTVMLSLQNFIVQVVYCVNGRESLVGK